MRRLFAFGRRTFGMTCRICNGRLEIRNDFPTCVDCGAITV